MINILKHHYNRFLQWRARCAANRVRHIPNEYFKGYRRLAKTPEDVMSHKGKCFACKHAVAYVTWHCDMIKHGCKWEPCHNMKELTTADLNAGYSRWLGLPDD
jgi:hypothetical protein